jgi:replicative DNA helicase
MTNETPPENGPEDGQENMPDDPGDYPNIDMPPAGPQETSFDGPEAPVFDQTPVASSAMPSSVPPSVPLEGPVVGDYAATASATTQDGPQYGERIAPCNIEAEQAVLGALLLQNEAYFRLSGFLKADHFYEPLHARLYSAMEDLIASGRVADPVTLKPRFENDADMAEIGGIGYLANLASASISLLSAVDYGRAIFDMAIRRGLIHIGEDMVSNAFDANAEGAPKDQIEASEASLYSLAEAGQYEGGFVDFSKALKESLDMTTAAYQRGSRLSGLSTGLKDLDAKLGGLQSSDLIIIAARPAMGKSSLACNIGLNVAKAYKRGLNENGEDVVIDGAAVAIFHLEMSSEQVATRLIAEESGVPSNQIRRGQIDEDEFRRIQETVQRIEACPIFIDDTGGINIAQLTSRARRLKRLHGIGLIIVDYIQLISGTGKATDNRVQEITQITMGLKALAKELDVPIIALAQLSRQVENRDDKRPQLSDLRESGSIEQDADVVMFIYREEYYRQREIAAAEASNDQVKISEMIEVMNHVHAKAEVIIAKQRHGPTGTVNLHFQGELTKFSDLAQEDHYDTSNLER